MLNLLEFHSSSGQLLTKDGVRMNIDYACESVTDSDISRYGELPLSGFLILSIVALLLYGCATSTQKSGLNYNNNSIYLVENRSIDLNDRRNFDEATELLKQERYDEAIELLKQVASNTPNNSAPYINLGIAYLRTERPELAETNFTKALEINPEHPVAINEFAVFYRETGRFGEARNLYERVVAKYPEFMPARRNYGILCELYLNDVPCALEQYEAYSKANPDDENIKIWIATLRQKISE